MKDVTHEMDQMRRGILVTTHALGILVDAGTEGYVYRRRWNSKVMEKDGVKYGRTGEIFEDDANELYVVYRRIG
jgi:hypothetical protein